MTSVAAAVPRTRAAVLPLTLGLATVVAFLEPVSRAVGAHLPYYGWGTVVAVSGAALWLGVAQRRGGSAGLDIHDRQLDYILGAGLLVSVLVLLALAGDVSAPVFGDYPDVLALPVWGAAVVVISCGARMLWRVRGVLALLVLMWPPLTGAVVGGLAPVVDPGLVVALVAFLALLVLARRARSGRRRPQDTGRRTRASPNGRRPVSRWRLALAVVAGAAVVCAAVNGWSANAAALPTSAQSPPVAGPAQ